jgi:hypothetical protein
VHFLPLARNLPWVIATAVAAVVLIGVAAVRATLVLLRRWRSGPPSRWPRLSRIPGLSTFQLLLAALAAGAASLFLPGGPLFDSTWLRIVFTGLVVLSAPVTATLVVTLVSAWREEDAPLALRAQVVAAAIASVCLTGLSLGFWLPIAWRSSDAGIARLAQRVHDAGIPVETTLVAYDVLGGPGKRWLVNDPTTRYLRTDTQMRWQQAAAAPGPPGYRYTHFMKKVVGALHRAGVSLVAATDAMGVPLVAPGSSLHRELELLVESGLPPYDALRAATVAPANLLGGNAEFGTVRVGARADLLLVDANPFAHLDTLGHPAGVMTRGRWYTRDELLAMVRALSAGVD